MYINKDMKGKKNYVNRWGGHAADAEGDVTWKLFTEWLTKVRRTARVARTRELSSLQDSEQTGAKNEKKTAVAISAAQWEETRTGDGDPEDRGRSHAQRDSFHTDTSVPQAVQFKAKAKPCPLCLQLNMTDTKNAYTRKFAQGQVQIYIQYQQVNAHRCLSDPNPDGGSQTSNRALDSVDNRHARDVGGVLSPPHPTPRHIPRQQG